MDLVAVKDAAEQLGVTTRQVQYLVARGELRPVARGLIDRASLDRHIATRQASRRRAWSENTAWAAVAMLSDLPTPWLGPAQRSRLRTALRQLTGAELVSRTRGRAKVQRYQGHSRTAERLRQEVVDTSGAVALLGLVEAPNYVDGYIAAHNLDKIVARHALIEDAGGTYILRATTMDLATVRALADEAPVLAALDLAESLDIRERRIGLNFLDDTLKRLNG
ncbi:helix-turn-helix domain-containing protein [Mycobacterium branderi]|uniref:Helix-turn-helix domain-containing protein n=1 Tax=Mycobacterium branderi TaxID=43348 RepID=A0ABN6B2C0_9MYCO|nr:helix-turn-helix domain-containing protein [Mycobacterium branderi]MCV7233436.1 helix-turn-helix domain-containing protein [Mycobacterium branderi]BBZ10552.1 hypothetical protein MBRA_07470 [Mycobacterium branderi]